MEEKLEEDSPRGLGIFLIQQLVDDVELRRNDGRTEFTMWFDIKKTPADASIPADAALAGHHSASLGEER
jgi:hypothetical protein